MGEAPEAASELLATRRRKLEDLRAAGIEPFPHAFPGVQPIEAVKAPHERLAPGAGTGAHARPPGPLAARPGPGKAALLHPIDRSRAPAPAPPRARPGG